MLVNNAGIGTSVPGGGERMESADGYELRFAVNYLAGYLLFRLAIEFIKPAPMQYWPGLSGIQWLCLGGLAYYGRHLPRLGRELAWATS